MKMITGYINSYSGNIEIGNIKVDENNTQTKKKIGYLPESNPLYAEMYVREYLGFIANIHHLKNKADRINE